MEELLKKHEDFEKTLAAQEEKFSILNRETKVKRPIIWIRNITSLVLLDTIVMLLTKGQEVFAVEDICRCTIAMYLQSNSWIKFLYNEIYVQENYPSYSIMLL